MLKESKINNEFNSGCIEAYRPDRYDFKEQYSSHQPYAGTEHLKYGSSEATWALSVKYTSDFEDVGKKRT